MKTPLEKLLDWVAEQPEEVSKQRLRIRIAAIRQEEKLLLLETFNKGKNHFNLINVKDIDYLKNI